MKKKSSYLLVGFLVLIFGVASAQFDRGDKLLNLGVGLNSALNGGVPLHASFEVGITDAISIGVGTDLIFHRYVIANVDYGYTAVYPAARFSYHFNKLFKMNIDELDIYGGGSVGFRVVSWKDSSPTGTTSSYDNSVFATVIVGARWYFKPSFGVFAEVGAGGASNGRAGIVLRF